MEIQITASPPSLFSLSSLPFYLATTAALFTTFELLVKSSDCTMISFVGLVAE